MLAGRAEEVLSVGDVLKCVNTFQIVTMARQVTMPKITHSATIPPLISTRGYERENNTP